MKIFKRSVWCLLTIFFALCFAVSVVGGMLTEDYSDALNDFFGTKGNYQIVTSDEDEDIDSEYYKSSYVETDENGDIVYTTDDNGYTHQVYDSNAMRENSQRVAEQVASEGAVLLWNDNDALPLSSGDKISLFGMTQNRWLTTGAGSSSMSVTTSGNVKNALEAKGLSVNSTLWNDYQNNRSSYYRTTTTPSTEDGRYKEYQVNEMPWSALSSSAKSSISSYGDAAIMIISRTGSEDGDTKFDNGTSECLDSDYLDLTYEEAGVLTQLKALKSAGTIDKIILVLNTATTMQMKNIMSDEYGIDACLWVGIGGNMSYEAFANVISGDTNPSGHLVDTYVYDVESAPSNENFGDFTFTEISSAVPASSTGSRYNKYVVYQEGIYVGYKYYETRYEDYVMGNGNADAATGVYNGNGGWSYSDEVAFSFGHGVSYTEFSYSDYSVSREGDTFTISMTITNSGKTYSGKEVMQIYLQKPYTDYDVENNVEKSSVELVGFAKTDNLAPGESQTLTVTVTEEQFKSYDSYGAKTYILEKGDYYLAAGTDAHDALNNILAEKGYSSNDGMDYDGDSSMVYKVTYDKDDFEKYSVSQETGVEITNQFDNADLNLYEGTSDQKITYLSRSDWKNTYPSAVSLKLTDSTFVADMSGASSVKDDGSTEMPLMGTVTSSTGEALSLITLKDLDYDDPLWDDLLNQLTWEEMNEMITKSYDAVQGAESVGAPGLIADDGTQGVKTANATTGTQMAFPGEQLSASTFDQELIEELGEAFGEEILHLGFSMTYSPGINIHRSAYSGRNWDYYSEDSFISGKIFAAQSRGMTSKGVVLCAKHFALNDQERNRHGLATFANEQSIRETYLYVAEIGVREGNVNGFMTAMNRIGTTWTGNHKGLLTSVLREEWGFHGLVETDYASSSAFMTTANAIAQGVVAGNNVWMWTGTVLTRYQENAVVVNAMRESCHSILYAQLNSSAMNGLTSNSKLVAITPWWQGAISTASTVLGIIMGVCAAMTVASFVVHIIKNKKSRDKEE